ncbi:unnamed protein product [Cochlearia groenlandica]
MNYTNMILIIVVIIIATVSLPTSVQSRHVNNGEEAEKIMKIKSEGSDTSRRILVQGRRYINYDTMEKDKPLKPGGKDEPDNKYKRDCNVQNHCHRFTN